MYFEDPNGIVLEITTPPSEAAPPSEDQHEVVRRFLADSAALQAD